MTSVRFFVFLFSGLAMEMSAQAMQANYDESKVPKYELPDPLVCLDGTRVTSKDIWNKKRRPEILKLFEDHVYGRQPELGRLEILEKSGGLLESRVATDKYEMIQHRIGYRNQSGSTEFTILLFLPPGAKKTPVPVFVGYNFYGNQTVHANPKIEITKSWARNNKEFGIENNRANEKSRGKRSSRWPIEEIVERGYGVATIYYGDVDPDFEDQFQNGVHPLGFSDGQTKPKPHEWGSIGGWAWGLSRALDYLEKHDDVDSKKVIVIGHSRLGKTSLWAGATDPRFAIVISNNSGCGGAALSRRAFGETVERINTSFPHWFCDNFNKYNGKEDELPVDQHMLISLIAPRPVYVASASEDRWADPKGEFLSAFHAQPVYRLFDKKGLGVAEMPKLNQSVGHSVGYHIREGKHDVTSFDWQKYIDFADRHFAKKTIK